MFARLLVGLLLAAPAGAQAALEVDAVLPGVRYDVLDGSTLFDANDVAPGGPTRAVRGAFVLRLLPTAAPFPTYRVSGLQLRTDEHPPVHVVQGGGFHHVFGTAPGGFQQMELVVDVAPDATDVPLSSGLAPQEVPFPTLEVVLTESTPGGPPRFVLTLLAEPRRRIEFSTEFELSSARFGPLRGGDLLASGGRVLARNDELTANLGLLPGTGDLGLDALGRTPAANRVLFSGETDAFSATLGPLAHGSLLNVDGFVAQTHAQLLAAFAPPPGTPDVGLDAYCIDLSTGEQWFSVEQPVVSQALGVTLQPGDLLSDAGYVVRTNAELLARFQIVGPRPEGYGLDAVARLPNGSLWFSVDEGFVDARLGGVGHGDVLSDNGHRVRGNLDLVWPLQPLEDLGDFGLDALHVGPLVPRGRMPVLAR